MRNARGGTEETAIMQWEYKVEITTEITSAKMNRLGEQGWELVCVVNSNGYERELYWKRAKPDPETTF